VEYNQENTLRKKIRQRVNKKKEKQITIAE